MKPKTIILSILIIILAAAGTFGAIKIIEAANAADETSAEESDSQVEGPESEPAVPDLINLQPVVDSWAASLSSGSAGVIIYDLDNDAIAASYHASDIYNTESLYKLFVVYEGYRRVEKGEIDPTDTISAGRSWATCLDLAIRESNSSCAEAMLAYFGAAALNQIIKTDYNINNTNLVGLTSTPSDIASIMKLFYEHSEFSEETWETIQDTMLEQPPVDNGLCSGPCDWRRGLSKGFTTATVYDKVGWYYNGNDLWNSYHDAAIVEFPELGRHYIIVVMTKNSYLKDVVRLGTEIEEYILNS